MKRILFLVVFVMIANVTFSQSKLMNKLVGKMATIVGGATTVTATSMNDVTLTVGMGSNLYPAELGTISQTFFKDWVVGGDQVSLTFTSKTQAGVCQIGGTVSIDGKPVEYNPIGTYSLITAPNSSPRKIEITTTDGKMTKFTITPNNKQIKILSINGQKDNISLDLSKDVIVELDVKNVPERTMLKVSLAINQVGVKSIYDVCYIRADGKLTIPAAAFRNINITPGGDAVYNYKNSYLFVDVESIEDATEVSGSISAIQYISYYSDGKFVTVSTEPELNKGLSLKGNEAEMDYKFFKPSAFLSRPESHIKKIGVTSFSIRGTTFHETSSSTTFTVASSVPGYVDNVTRTTIKTYQFPQQTNEVWDALLEKLYPQFMEVVKSEFGCEDILVDKITSCDAYKSTNALSKDDANTKIEFARSYRDTKVISAFLPFGDGYGANSINQRIMNETGTDALMTMTLDLQIATGTGNTILMVPRFAFEIVGKSNGPLSNTKYLTGTISSTSGVKVPEDMTPDELEMFVRKSALLDIFRKGIREMIAKEKANGDYDVVWNLQL